MRTILPVLGLLLAGCATTTEVLIPTIPLHERPAFTRLSSAPECIEMSDSGPCQAWKVTRRQFVELSTRDAEKDAEIDRLRANIEAHNRKADGTR